MSPTALRGLNQRKEFREARNGGAAPMTTLTDPVAITALHSHVRGRVIGPEHEDYDRARSLFYGGFDRRPAAVARVADVEDVRRVVSFAQEHGLPLAVRGGAHSAAGHSVPDDALVIDLRELRDMQIDDGAGTAWAGTGLTAAEVTAALDERGLAIGFGDTGSVGIGGITLGGGVGYLVRKHGLTIDSLLAAELVTADGELHRVDAETEPDLFWAIRGGGGNFGVATRFLYRVHALDGAYGGMLMLPATTETVAGFMEAAEAAPDELSGIANVMPAPPMPMVPEERQGQLSIMALMTYAGPAEVGERALAPFRALGEPIVDQLAAIRYPAMYPPEDDTYHPAAVGHTMFLDRIDLSTAETIVGYLNASDATMRVAQLRVLGGAYAQVPADATAYAHRSRKIMANLAAFYEGEPDKEGRQAWIAEFAAAIAQGEGDAYVNFLADEGPERVRAAYPGATWDRLRQIKARYDETNMFRFNQNIPPAGTGGDGAGAA
jgi:FAD/FMN-containing dehydrogenase